MRLLLDECVDRRLFRAFGSHACQTAKSASLAGLSEGKLLDTAEAAGFDVLVTVDQNIPSQQNMTGRRIPLLVLCGPTNQLRDPEPLVAVAMTALISIGRGHAVAVRR